MSLIQVSNLTFAYDGSYENIFEDVSFQIDTNWRLGFTGRNGRGKTTFLNLLLGKFEYRGSISASVRFSYFGYPRRRVGYSEMEESVLPCHFSVLFQIVDYLDFLDLSVCVHFFFSFLKFNIVDIINEIV